MSMYKSNAFKHFIKFYHTHFVRQRCTADLWFVASRVALRLWLHFSTFSGLIKENAHSNYIVLNNSITKKFNGQLIERDMKKMQRCIVIKISESTDSVQTFI